MAFGPAKRVLANSTSKPQTALGLEPGERKTSSSMPQRVLDRFYNLLAHFLSLSRTITDLVEK
jgi:hypothetical protein